MRYRVSKDAQRDLDEIFLYWARRAGLRVADRLIDSITERFWVLGEHPDAGKPSEDFAPGVRCFPAGKYLVYYRKTRRGTDILHIFHGARTRSAPSRKRVRAGEDQNWRHAKKERVLMRQALKGRATPHTDARGCGP
ncbi:MAG TPA: type II toxin-antitoxin system RelE/ParE family toxin [Terriglobia bacterium]